MAKSRIETRVLLSWGTMLSRPDVTVVGAGVFGAWTAWHLRRAGAQVRLCEAWAPGHSRSSSGGETRIIRMGYGADEIYTRMALRSLDLWQEFGGGLLHRTGVLWMARHGDAYSAATRETLVRAGAEFEILERDELGRRYPQMQIADAALYGIWEPRSGVLMARRAVAAVVADAVRNGVEFQVREVRPPVDGGTVVFACGPWLPKLFPEVLGQRIFPTRQEVFFFAPPAGDTRFDAAAFPAWVDFSDPRGPYGVPDIEGRGFKLALDRHGPAFDPDSGDRRPSENGLREAREFLAERFPALAEQPMTEARVCQYENTSNGDFLIDRHPELPNVWLVGGGSGHGFKHGPAVGEYVSERVLNGGAVDPRFALTAKETVQHRTVH
jgi:glycine/D-amino acid oxidase-like deaminating enzyme